jgi:hypothetical protein
MAAAKLKTLPACHVVVLRDALEQASRTLPGVQRTSAVKACLADNILALAATGESDPTELGLRALTQVRQSCARCGGCEGLTPVPTQRLSQPTDNQAYFRSVQGRGRWN